MALIDIKKVREWTVEFVIPRPLTLFPIPARIVMEHENAGYRIAGLPPPLNRHLHGGQLTITLSGRGCFRGGNTVHDLLPGSAFLYRIADPEVTYYYPPEAREPWTFLWMHFDGDAAERLIAQLNEQYGYCFDIAGNDELPELLLRYRSSAGKAFFLSPWEGARLALDVFELLCRPLERQEALEPAAKLTLQVQKLVTEQLEINRTAGQLAAELEVSREHLCKVFKEKTNRTILEYQTARRLERAMELLEKTTLSCKEIAIRCGFGSYSSFYRNFLRRYRRQPESFRRCNS